MFKKNNRYNFFLLSIIYLILLKFNKFPLKNILNTDKSND